jgi:putative ABC transport system permease protein
VSELFGIPVDSLLVVLLIATGIVAGIVAALALKNRVLLRLGVRNVRRRGGRTALIVLGLMLGTTIISAALTTGDTMSNTIRETAIASLGETDVVVSAKGAAADIPGELGAATGTGYFDEGAAADVHAALAPKGLVDGVTPAIVEEVALQAPARRQNEPGVNLFAADPATMDGFGPIEPIGGGRTSLADLAPGEVFLNRDAAEELHVGAGDEILVYAGEAPVSFRVRDVVDYEGAGTADSALLLPLAQAQILLGREGLIKQVLVSNRGEGSSGVELSDQVVETLEPLEETLGLEAVDMKEDALETADEVGNAFMSFFTTFGTFSIAAGILLVFLIFVMLAAERRGELGIARAIGTRRGHLIQMFVFEGLAYDLAAAFAGALLGAAIAYGMVLVMAEAFGATDADAGLQLEFALEPRSLVISFALGVLFTLIVVAVSAWRVSRMTISTAIRKLPEPLLQKRRRRWLLGGLGVAVGLVLAFGGATGGTATPLMLGVSIVIVSLVPIFRAIGMPERVAYTSAGVALVGLLLAPWSAWEAVFGELSMDFSTWITSGLMIVVGAVFAIMYNADLLLGVAMRSLGRIRALTPILRMAMAYPLTGRFRTGTTLAMFTLVVFTLVTGTVASGSFNHAFNDADKFGGGFDVRAGTGAANPIEDMDDAISSAPELDADDFGAVGSQSVLAVDVKQVGTGRPYETYVARGLDRSFLEQTTFELGAMARGYTSAHQVWDALASQPGLAVVDSYIVPRRDNFNFVPAETDFRLSGFYFDDGTFDPIPVDMRDPQTGKTVELTVIGVLSDTAPWEMVGVSTSMEGLAAAFPDRASPTIHYFDLAPGVDPEVGATQLEAAFVASGMDAESIEQVAEDAVASARLFNRLIQGFMGLGLIVGVAALGVISARAVVERRQQIGVLRAIGFRRGMVETTFLLESSFVALTSIVVGTALGLVLAYEIILDSRQQPSWNDLELVVPWANLGIIFLIVYVVAIAATLAPALRASRIRPAEALRYE